MDSAFPRLSPDGRHVASGASQIWVDGKMISAFGTTPVWHQDSRSVLYTGNGGMTDGFLFEYRLDETVPRTVRPVKGHDPASVATGPGGLYAIEVSRTILVSNGRVIPSAFRPTWAGADLCWGVDDGTSVTLYREGRFVAHSVHQHRGLPDGRLVFTRYTPGREPRLEVNVAFPDGTVQDWGLRGAYEFNPCSVTLAGEPWVLSNTSDNRLLLRTGNNGVVLATGETYDPDIASIDADRVRVVYQDGARTLRDMIRSAVTLEQEDLRTVAYTAHPPGPGWTERHDITEIEVARYLFGTVANNDVPRIGAPPGVTLSWPTHYTHRMQSRVTQNHTHQCKELGDGVFGQVWTFSQSLQAMGLAWDQTDGKRDRGGYRVVNRGTLDTAPLFPKFAPVGRMFSVPVDILHVDTGVRESHVWTGGVRSVWDGPGGMWACIVWDFQHKGLIEENWCLRDVGMKTWIETNEKTQEKRTAYFWNPAPPFTSIPEAKFTDAFPKAAPTEVDPVPKTDVLTREQFNTAFRTVNDFYKSDDGLQRPGGMIIDGEVDTLALSHWIYALVVKERTAEQCIREIRQSDEWRSKHPEIVPDPQ